MITVISGTNRAESATLKISQFCHEFLSSKSSSQLLDLTHLPAAIIHDQMYEKDGLNRELWDIQDTFMVDAGAWLIVSPEYNGSFPGILKLFIDAISIRKYKETFFHKKVGLIGVSTGRAGNLRGMEHLTSLLNYLNVTIYPNKLPISTVNQVVDSDGIILNETNLVLTQYLNDFVAWTSN